MPMPSPAKFHHGDPLFSAVCNHSHVEEHHLNNDRRRLHHQEDPILMDLMIHCPKSSSLPLHSYYSEFRLGQGDPLIKAAMKRWPFTTIPDDENEEAQNHEQQNLIPRTRALAIPPCRVLSAPLSSSSLWLSSSTESPTATRRVQEIVHMDNVGHIERRGGTTREETHERSPDERRFILMSEDRRFVLVE